MRVLSIHFLFQTVAVLVLLGSLSTVSASRERIFSYTLEDSAERSIKLTEPGNQFKCTKLRKRRNRNPKVVLFKCMKG